MGPSSTSLEGARPTRRQGTWYKQRVLADAGRGEGPGATGRRTLARRSTRRRPEHDEASAVRQVRSVLRAGLVGLGWLVSAGLAALAALHLAHREPSDLVVGLINATPWVYMPAWVTASIGLFWRRWALTSISLLLVVLQFWWVAPDFDPFSHLTTPGPGEVTVRLFDWNCSQDNADLAEAASEISRDRAQVVALEELTPAALQSLDRTHAMERFGYTLVRAMPGPDGNGLWSVYPLEDAHEWFAAGHAELRAWLELPGRRRLRVDVVHTDAPYGPGGPGLWEDQIGAIRAGLAREPLPLVVAGDLNSTWYDWHFQALLGLGLKDAAVVAGQGWRMTWPRDQQPVVPYLAIDHVLLSRGVGLESYGLGDGRGSDHHPLRVTLVVGGRRG